MPPLEAKQILSYIAEKYRKVCFSLHRFRGDTSRACKDATFIGFRLLALVRVPELIFVTNVTNYICRKKLSWGEIFGEILGNFEKFWEIFGDFATIYALSCGEKLSPKSTFVEKKNKYEVWRVPGAVLSWLTRQSFLWFCNNCSSALTPTPSLKHSLSLTKKNLPCYSYS